MQHWLPYFFLWVLLRPLNTPCISLVLMTNCCPPVLCGENISAATKCLKKDLRCFKMHLPGPDVQLLPPCLMWRKYFCSFKVLVKEPALVKNAPSNFRYWFKWGGCWWGRVTEDYNRCEQEKLCCSLASHCTAQAWKGKAEDMEKEYLRNGSSVDDWKGG